MNNTTRDLIYRLGSELAGIMEHASVTAATLPTVRGNALSVVIAELERDAARCQSLAAAMLALLSDHRVDLRPPAISSDHFPPPAVDR